eukprot:757114-Hanusia_phi.AAC.1
MLKEDKAGDEHRKRQREGKASERAVQRKLIERLDGLVPVAVVGGRFLNGTLRSGRTTVQLYEDCIGYCKELLNQEPGGGRVGRGGSRQGSWGGGEAEMGRPLSVAGAELMEACLSSCTERMLVVDLPEWTVVAMSSRMRQDFASAAFEHELVMQTV